LRHCSICLGFLSLLSMTTLLVNVASAWNGCAGIINEALGTNLPDPTSLLGAYTGAARYMWDDMRGKVATNVASQMFRENSWLRDLIGDTHVQHLTDMLEQSYEGSVKAELDRLGAASHTLHGSPDPSLVPTGVEDIAPSFNRSALIR
jgi:hypothetical protein